MRQEILYFIRTDDTGWNQQGPGNGSPAKQVVFNFLAVERQKRRGHSNAFNAWHRALRHLSRRRLRKTLTNGSSDGPLWWPPRIVSAPRLANFRPPAITFSFSHRFLARFLIEKNFSITDSAFEIFANQQFFFKVTINFHFDKKK